MFFIKHYKEVRTGVIHACRFLHLSEHALIFIFLYNMNNLNKGVSIKKLELAPVG